MAEGVGFEPTVGLLLLLISSQVPLTTQPPFRYVDLIELNAGFHISQFAFSILLFYTIRMKTNSSDNKDARWQKTPVANLVRHVQSSNYYARIRVRGKLIWKSLKTDRISVAKLRLGDFHKEERQRAAAQTAVARGKMTFADAVQTYRERLGRRPVAQTAKAKYTGRNGSRLC